MGTALPTYRRIKADAAEWFDAEQVKKAKDYQRPLTIASVTSLVINAVMILVLLATGAAPRVADAIAGDGWVLRLIVVMVGFLLLYEVVNLPMSIWTEFSHEKKWGFSTQTPQRFVVDEIKGLVLGVVVQLPLLLVLWWLIRSTDLWWILGWAVFFLFSVILALLFPIVIMPMFNKFTPLEDEELNTRIHGIVEGAGMKLSGVEVMDASKRTRKDNAFFAGLGKTRKVVIFDNLLAQPHPVIGSVVAHELGHWRRRHIMRAVLIGTVTSLLLFAALRFVSTWDAALDFAGVQSFEDPASLPLVLLVFVVASSVTGLVQSWFSRAHERQADLDALELTKDYDAFIETHHGLATRNLGDLVPSWWKYIRASHPPAAERLQLGKLWLEAQGPVER
jgi:STE24 endopeptidase